MAKAKCKHLVFRWNLDRAGQLGEFTCFDCGKNIRLPKAKPSPTPRKCRTCNSTGLVSSGVPSMPMPCGACNDKKRKSKGRK